MIFWIYHMNDEHLDYFGLKPEIPVDLGSFDGFPANDDFMCSWKDTPQLTQKNNEKHISGASWVMEGWTPEGSSQDRLSPLLGEFVL